MSADLREVYRALDPLSPLDPGSGLYVERPDNPMERVAVELELSDRPRHHLLVGHRGTGKTTELRRLANALAGKRDVLMVDVGEAANLTRKDFEEILLAAVRSSLDQQPLKHYHEILDWLQSRGRAGEARAIPIVVVFDGLERFQRDEDVLRALLTDFPDFPPVYAWPMSVICTIPLSLHLSHFEDYARHFDRTIFLPGISASGRNGDYNELGTRVLASIIVQRAGIDTFDPEAAGLLIRNSAGIHRELLQLAQRACVLAALGGAVRVTQAHAEAAIAEQSNEYSIMLRTGDYPVLADIMETKQLPGGSDVARLIRNQLIVAYANGTTWFDVHPILRPLLERKVVTP
jgi:AAA domain